MRFLLNGNKEVSVYTVVAACISLTLNGKSHTLCNACRNLKYNLFRRFNQSASATLAARFFNHLTGSVTARARRLCLSNSKDRTGGSYNISRSLTIRAGLYVRVTCSTFTAAIRAGHKFGHLNSLLHTAHYLLQCQLHTDTDIASAFNTSSAAGASSAKHISEYISKSATAAESASEYISKVAEDILYREALRATESACTLSSKAKLVITFSLCVI